VAELVVRIRPDDAGGVAVRTYGRTSQARHDPISDDVVGVIDGAFVRIDTNADDARVVAQLTMGPEESGFGAVFVEPDGVAGWWVGLGGIDNDYGIADRWRALVRVAADGSIERWPVENAPEYIDTVVLDGDRLVSSEHTIALPAAGSSAVGATVRAVLRDEYSYEFDLGDGRSVRPVADDRASSVELIGRDGGSTRLEHLLEVQHAVGVVDGPTADPESIRREPRTRVVASPWITPNETPVTVQQPAVSYSTESTVPENPATPIAGANDQSPTRAPDGVAQTESDSSNGWRLGVVVGAALVVGVVVLALIRHRLRRRTA
jgi:hypothetical protein